MALSWSTRRQLLYTAVGGIVAVVILFGIWETFFTSAPSCTDGKQNGTETGVDCGGTCSLVCKDTAHEAVVSWARAFPAGVNTYTAAAYITNSNASAGARNVRYSFRLFDADNILVIEHDGVAQIPPVQTVPVIDTNINVGNRTVAHTFFAFSDDTITWVKVSKDAIPAIGISEQKLATDGSKLEATLTNESIAAAKKITVAAVLFDDSNTAVAASKSVIDLLPGKSSQPIVFTWPAGNPSVVRADITVLPSF